MFEPLDRQLDGPSAGIAVLIPLTFTIDPTPGIIMLAAIYYGAMYGATISSVLINTPGDAATAASRPSESVAAALLATASR